MINLKEKRKILKTRKRSIISKDINVYEFLSQVVFFYIKSVTICINELSLLYKFHVSFFNSVNLIFRCFFVFRLQIFFDFSC
jgi:hypothetical protein